MREWESYKLLHSRMFYSPAPDFSPLPMATLNHALLHSIHRILLLSSSYRPGHSDLKARDLLRALAAGRVGASSRAVPSVVPQSMLLSPMRRRR